MALSNQSVERLADSLSEDFNVFVTEYYNEQLSELFADAACLFVDSELGPVDGDLAADLALRLIQRQYIGVNQNGPQTKF